MNRIVIIGNGFDIAHGLPTRYEDFLNHLKSCYVEFLKEEIKNVTLKNHKYFSLVPKDNPLNKRNEIVKYIIYTNICEFKTWEDIENLIGVVYRTVNDFGTGSDNNSKPRIQHHNGLINTSFNNYKKVSWGGIENDYKDALIKIINSQPKENAGGFAEKLNLQLQEIIEDLIAYLAGIKIPPEINEEILTKLYTKPLLEWRGKKSEVETFGSVRLRQKSNPDTKIDNILFLNFNYTSTINKYLVDSQFNGRLIKDQVKFRWISEDIQTSVRYIHGDLNSISSNPIIFGYGDEQDEHQVILETMDNEFFKHIKSVQYTRTAYYREMIDFADAEQFDIIIYGHSCSNTDRTLLNTLFEHNNCISIQPYLYDNRDSSIYNNIYRCFKDKKLMRSRVVDQTNTICKS